MVRIGNDWDELLAGEWDKPYYRQLREFLRQEYSEGTVYPPAGDIFNALKLTSYDAAKVVILGQDPYHEPGQAQGLSFSVPNDVQAPPSLVNILKELESDLAVTGGGMRGDADAEDAFSSDDGALSVDSSRRTADPDNSEISGILVPWARQGVLLLNTVLTVRAHAAGSHRGKGWEQFTDRVIELLAEREKPLVFVLWGSHAGSKKDLIIRAQAGVSGAQGPAEGTSAGTEPAGSVRMRHLIIQAPHPSPLSAYRGFFGGRYFSRANYFLTDNGIDPVDWRL